MYSFYLLVMSTMENAQGDLSWDYFVLTDMDDLRHVVEHDWDMENRMHGWENDYDCGEICVVRVCRAGRFNTEIDLRPLLKPQAPKDFGDPRQSVDWTTAAIPPLQGEPLPQGRPVRIGGTVYQHGHTHLQQLSHHSRIRPENLIGD